MLNINEQLEVGFSIDFNEVEKGFDPETGNPCYLVHGTNHFTVKQGEELLYTDGFSNPVAYIDRDTKGIRIDGLTTFWHDDADEDEIEFTDNMQQLVVEGSDAYCENLAKHEAIVKQLFQLIDFHYSEPI